MPAVITFMRHLTLLSLFYHSADAIILQGGIVVRNFMLSIIVCSYLCIYIYIFICILISTFGQRASIALGRPVLRCSERPISRQWPTGLSPHCASGFQTVYKLGLRV